MIMNKYDINKEQRTGVRYIIDPNAPVDAEGLKRFQDSLIERDANEMGRQIDITNKSRKDWIDKEYEDGRHDEQWHDLAVLIGK